VSRGTNGTLRADYNGSAVAVSDPGVALFFNTAAFSVPPPGQFGNAPRNFIIGPGSRLLNGQMSRDIRMKNNRALTLQVTGQQPAQHGQLRRHRHGRQLPYVRPRDLGAGDAIGSTEPAVPVLMRAPRSLTASLLTAALARVRAGRASVGGGRRSGSRRGASRRSRGRRFAAVPSSFRSMWSSVTPRAPSSAA
jgi:hypothetical protein